ncbi:MAG: 2OG-Fe(II) oxygenase, partial [Candidatus Binatia bacterium]
MAPPSIRDRLAALDWKRVERAICAQGFAVLPALLTARECRATAPLFDDDRRFRQTIEMARYRFGEG